MEHVRIYSESRIEAIITSEFMACEIVVISPKLLRGIRGDAMKYFVYERYYMHSRRLD